MHPENISPTSRRSQSESIFSILNNPPLLQVYSYLCDVNLSHQTILSSLYAVLKYFLLSEID